MKKIVILLVSVIFLLSSELFAQLRPAQSQYLQQTGALVNPSFEQGFKGWTITGDCTQSLVSDIPYLNKTLKLTCVNQSFTVKQNTDLSGFVDQQALITAQVKANIGGMSVNSLTNDVVSSTASVIAGDYKSINIPVKVGATSNGVEFSASSVTGEFFIDEVSLRLAPDLSYQVGQAQFVGQLTVSGADACEFENTTSTYDAFPVDSDCAGAYSTIGSLQSPDTNIPAFKIPNARTDGYYKVTADAVFATVNTTANVCYFSLSSTSSFDEQPSVINVRDANQYTNQLDGNFRFDTSGDKTIQILARSNDNINICRIFADGNVGVTVGHRSLKFTVHFYPDSNSTIVTQKSQSPNKAGFITWSAFDGDIEGHLKADGACVDKTIYSDYFKNVGNTYGDCDAGGGANTGVNLPDLITDNRFIRAADGTTITLGTTQTDLVGEHNHTIPTLQASGTNGGGWYEVFSKSSNINLIGNTTDDTDLTGTGIGSETRPNNIAFIPYVKMFDSDYIIGKFEQIEEVTADLTAATANELSAIIQADGTVTSENYDFINGNCAPSGGNITCNYNSGIFSQEPALTCTAVNSSGSTVSNCEKNATSNTSFTVKMEDVNPSTFTANALLFHVKISKQGIDVNKSFTGAVINASQSAQTIADIVREDIISTDLCQVIASNNDAEIVTTDTEDIPWKTEEIDNCNAWGNGGNAGSNTNDQYTAQKDGLVLVNGYSYHTTAAINAIDVYINGSLTGQRCGINYGTGSGQTLFSCIINLNKNDLLTFRVSSNNVTLVASAGHYISITELPDTASIVENLNQNPRVSLQDQYSESEIPWGKWNGEQLYRRCFTVGSDLTTGTTIVTWDTGLAGKNMIIETGNRYIFQMNTVQGTSSNRNQIRYDSDTGNVEAVLDGTSEILAGTSFCMDYTK